MTFDKLTNPALDLKSFKSILIPCLNKTHIQETHPQYYNLSFHLTKYRSHGLTRERVGTITFFPHISHFFRSRDHVCVLLERHICISDAKI